jgi:hypothetical protein
MPDNNEPTEIQVRFAPKPRGLEETAPDAEARAKPLPEPEDASVMRIPLGGRGKNIRVVFRTGDTAPEKALDKIPANPLPKRKEKEQVPQGTGMLDKAVNLLNAAFEEASALPPREKHEFLQRLRSGGKRLHILPEKGTFKPYPSGGDALAWLEEHWGDYLKYFGADRDYLSQDQLRKLDPKLMRALDNQIRYKNRKGTMKETVRDIIPAKSERLDIEVEDLSPEERQEIWRTARATSTRAKRRQQHAPAPEQ